MSELTAVPPAASRWVSNRRAGRVQLEVFLAWPLIIR